MNFQNPQRIFRKQGKQADEGKIPKIKQIDNCERKMAGFDARFDKR